MEITNHVKNLKILLPIDFLIITGSVFTKLI